MTPNYSAWAARWRVPLGFGFAMAYAVVSRPRLPYVVAGGVVALLGLILRGLAAGYIEKSRSLATAGPFAYTRNPLYLGSFILGAGFVIAGAFWILAAVYVPLFTLVYLPVMRNEEYYLHQKFGREFEEYAKVVPLFFPIPGRGVRGVGNFHWAQFRNNREYNAAAGYLVMMVFLGIKMALRLP